MRHDTTPYGRKTQHEPAVEQMHILWLTAGLGCDGDTISITAATQPSIEDVVMGAIPGLPNVHFHNPVLSYEVGDDFLQNFYDAVDGRLEPFMLVVEGSIPNEQLKTEGYWAAFGSDKETGQPITTCEWIDRLVPKAWAVVAAGTCATYGGIHAMEGLFLAGGPGVRKGERFEGAAIIDLAPTILYALGKPVPRDMDGKVLLGAFTDAFTTSRRIERVDVEGGASREAYEYSEDEQKVIEERLQALGYFD